MTEQHWYAYDATIVVWIAGHPGENLTISGSVLAGSINQAAVAAERSVEQVTGVKDNPDKRLHVHAITVTPRG